MSIEFVETFEYGSNLQSINSSGAGVLTPALDGDYHLRIVGGSGGFSRYAIPASATKVFHFYYQYEAVPASEKSIFRWLSGITELGSLRLTPSQTLRAYTSTGSLFASGTKTLAINSLYHIQCKVTIHDSTGLIEIYVDAAVTPDISQAGDTKPATESTIDRFDVTGGISASDYFDNIIVDGSTYLGIWKAKRYSPIANGFYTDMTGTWADVDEIPNDGNTTKIIADANTERESFTFAPHGLPASAVIKGVMLEAVSQKISSGQLRLGTRIGGVNYMGAAKDLALNFTSNGSVLQELQLLDPSDSLAWTLADLVPEMVLEAVI